MYKDSINIDIDSFEDKTIRIIHWLLLHYSVFVDFHHLLIGLKAYSGRIEFYLNKLLNLWIVDEN